MMEPAFNKRFYTPRLFFGDIGFMLGHIPSIVGTFRDKHISKAFSEKIMNVVTAVNGCIYCSWLHARQALYSGISQEELKNVIKLQFQADASEYELTALLYAQHYAETNRNPDPEMNRRLFDHYGDKTARHIIIIIRLIFFGNLYGNTWDAVISRFKGKPAKNSNLLFELIFFLLNFVVMFPAMWLTKGYRKKMPGT
ncbi:MAG: carboxymuconolactone decarboxylase family protein [Prolixibacteraceae bacterium]|nr:carboxymuconolactone decarboxylase family protein [Prolixibacteraceae bacterium]